MKDHGDALLVVRDGQAESLVAFDAKRLLREHARLVDGVHVRDQHDVLGAGALERRLDDLAELLRRVFHAVDLRRRGAARLDQLDLTAECAQAFGDEVGDLVQTGQIAAAGFDADQLRKRIEQRLLFLGCERGDARIGRSHG